MNRNRFPSYLFFMLFIPIWLVACFDNSVDMQKSGYLFLPDECSIVSIHSDSRETISTTPAKTSSWIFLSTSDVLIFSIGITGKEAIEHPEEMEPPQKKKRLRTVMKVKNLAKLIPEKKTLYDSVLCHFIVKVEDNRGQFHTLFDKKINPVQSKGDAFWITETPDLDKWENRRIRFHFSVTNEKETTNRGYFTNPVFINRETHKRKKGVLFLSLDTMRADHAGCYGYPRNTTPNIDFFSRKALHYSRVISPAPLTLPTHISLFTGLYPYMHGIKHLNDRPLSSDIRTVTEIIRKRRILTAAFTEGAFMSPVWGLNRGFHSFNYKGMIDQQTDRCIRWLDLHAGNVPFFCFLHTYEIHSPYNTKHPRFIFSDKKRRGRHSSRRANSRIRPSQEKLQALVDAYDDGIRYTDGIVGNFLRRLAEMKLAKNMDIFIFSDHGEEFFEHGKFEHGENLFNETLNVPLLWKRSDDSQGGLVTKPVPLLSLTSTLLHLNDMDPSVLFFSETLPVKGTRTETGDGMILSETTIKGSMMRCISENKAFVISLNSAQKLDIDSYDLDADPAELSRLSPEDIHNVKLTKMWSSIQRQTQIWISIDKPSRVEGTIKFDSDQNPIIIYNSDKRDPLIKKNQIIFDHHHFSGILGITLSGSKGSVYFALRVNDQLILPTYFWKADGELHEKKLSSFSLPLSPYCSRDEKTVNEPPIQQSGIALFSYPELKHSETSDAGEFLPSAETLEELRILGYID